MSNPPPLESQPERHDRRPPIDPNLEFLARWTDSAFRIPVLGKTCFGFDVLGLVPGLGDTVSSIVSLYILNAVCRHGIPRAVLLQMAANVAIDYLLGSVPLLGDLFDVYWKANLKNVALLRQHATTVPASNRRSRISDRLFMGALILGLLAILIGSIIVAYFIVLWLAHLWQFTSEPAAAS